MTKRKQVKWTKNTLDNAEDQLRYLNSQIIAFQEIERKRISRELHDELGQDLSLIKFKIRFIKKNLFTNQTALQQECEDTIEFIDQVIENVRRLSRDLSPTVLDDLGLTAAIRWLVNNLKASEKHLDVVTNLIDIDHYFPEDAHINIYRIMQEALTNIREHARAENVSIVIEKHDDTIAFLIEDDGEGFDVHQALMKITIERGLGLASMAERVQMLGGVFDLSSETGKGTRIGFSIPIKREGSK